MITTVRLDGVNNYLIDKNGNIIDRYIPNSTDIKLIIKLEDGSTLEVDSNMIKQNYGGQITVQYNSDRFIIDDGYQNVLIKAGYFVYKDYDMKREYNTSIGIDNRKYIIDSIREKLPSISKKFNPEGTIIESTIDYSNYDTSIIIENGPNQPYRYIINIDTIDTFVYKNHMRRDNKLTYYPFEKYMDKYGTVYISIFAEKIENTDINKYDIPDTFVSDMIYELGKEFHYSSVPVKKQIIYWKNL